MDKLTVILYNAGAAGDMVASVIDKTDYGFDFNRMKVSANSHRMKLIRAHFDGLPNHADNFASNGLVVWDRLTVLLDEIVKNKIYTAIASHDFDYFAPRKDRYNIILIDDTDPVYGMWAHNRANKIAPNVHIINDHTTQYRKTVFPFFFLNHDKRIYLKDILEGNLIKHLSTMVPHTLNSDIYEHWLKLQN
jgi:hypothetical protein